MLTCISSIMIGISLMSVEFRKSVSLYPTSSFSFTLEGTSDDELDEKDFIKKVKKIEDSAEYGKAKFMGETMVYGKNAWQGKIFPKKSERVWSKVGKRANSKPTPYMALMKLVNEHPGIVTKRGQQRVKIRKMVKDEVYHYIATLERVDSISKEELRDKIQAIIKKCIAGVS